MEIMKTIFHTACKVERESLLYCLPQTTGAHDSNTETIPMSKRVRWTWLGMLRHIPSHGNHETKNPHYVPHKKFFCHIHNSTSLHIRVMHHHVLNASAAVERGQKFWKSQTVHENCIFIKIPTIAKQRIGYRMTTSKNSHHYIDARVSPTKG